MSPLHTNTDVCIKFILLLDGELVNVVANSKLTNVKLSSQTGTVVCIKLNTNFSFCKECVEFKPHGQLFHSISVRKRTQREYAGAVASGTVTLASRLLRNSVLDNESSILLCSRLECFLFITPTNIECKYYSIYPNILLCKIKYFRSTSYNKSELSYDFSGVSSLSCTTQKAVFAYRLKSAKQF